MDEKTRKRWLSDNEGVFKYVAESTAACYVFLKNNNHMNYSLEKMYCMAFTMSYILNSPDSKKSFLDLKLLASNYAGLPDDEAIYKASLSIIDWKFNTAISHLRYGFFTNFLMLSEQLPLAREELKNAINDVLRRQHEHQTYKSIGERKLGDLLETSESTEKRRKILQINVKKEISKVEFILLYNDLYKTLNRTKRIGIEAYTAETITAFYLLVKKYGSGSTLVKYYLAFIMSTLPYIEKGAVDIYELEIIAINAAKKPEYEALLTASAYIEAREICSVDSKSETMLENLFFYLLSNKKMNKAVKGVLKKQCKHPVYKALDTENFRSVLKEIEAKYSVIIGFYPGEKSLKI